ncbi:MAG: zinc ribbon domain-containing protein [Alphaproteobacteria bacterium]|nr:zinc ribbon domain-containing protein [Alphaproteobacteria bacterium]
MGATTAENRSGRGKGKQRSRQPVGTTVCPSCCEANQSGARFCQACGRSLTGGGWLDAPTLTVLGAACLTLVALGLLFASVIDTEPTPSRDPVVGAPSRTASAPSGQPPDLSTMSPREAADRLFNRVMIADEQGDADEVAQFAPMAATAYQQLGDLDLDGLFHLGMIQAAAGDVESAGEVVERLRAIVPGHLLASLLEHRLAMAESDQERAERAVERFEADYQEEIKVDRLEYRDHRPSIERFREQIDAAARDGG